MPENYINIDRIKHTRSNNTSDTYMLVDSSARISLNLLTNQVNNIQTKVDTIPDTGNPFSSSGSVNSTNKLYLTGAQTQEEVATTYSNQNVYTQNGLLYANSYNSNDSTTNPDGSNAVLTWYDVYNTTLTDSDDKIPTQAAVKNYIDAISGLTVTWLSSNSSDNNAVRMANTLVESNNYTMGEDSIAEGLNTKAAGDYSYAQGYNTSALYRSQHVFGQYNEEDPIQNKDSDDRGTYIQIVGNGDISTASNARTLDWDGNEQLAGRLTLGLGGIDYNDAPTIQQVEQALNMDFTALDGEIGSLNITYNILTS